MKIDDLPFLKRWAFQTENEFRAIFESKGKAKSTLDVAIPLACIKKITLSPWLHRRLFKDVKQVINSVKGCENIEVSRSTLIGNEEWKSAGNAAR